MGAADAAAAAGAAAAAVDLPTSLTPMMVLGILMCLSQPFELMLPTLVIGNMMPRQQGFRRRAAIALAVWCVASMAITPLLYLYVLNDADQLFMSTYSFFSSLFILLCAIPTVMYLFEASVWKALFCVSAGYTIQNIGSGLAELICLLARRLTGLNLTANDISSLNGTAPLVWAISAAAYLGVFLVSYLVFIRRVRRGRLNEVEDRKMMAVLLLVILAVIAFDVVNKNLDKQGVGLGTLVILRFVHFAVCLFLLFVQFEMLYSRTLEQQMRAERQLAAERERQYQLSRQNIDAINIKCHDIKHQIRALADGDARLDEGALRDLAAEVSIYDSIVRTGNEALDTILTEKGLLCGKEGISLSCIADGQALACLSPAEIYSLFGNALDNAIAAVGKVPDAERRSISLVVRRVGALASIHVENYFDAAAGPTFVDGLPQTSQDDKSAHGFGALSMRRTVEAHGGTLTFGTRGDVFLLDAMLPVG